MSKKIFEIVEQEYIVYRTGRVYANTKEEAIELYTEDPSAYQYDGDSDSCNEIISVNDITEKEISYLQMQINSLQNHFDSINIDENSKNRSSLELRKAQLNVDIQKYKNKLEEITGD